MKKAKREGRQCDQCHEWKPLSSFLKLSNRSFKTTYCDGCSGANMSAYWKMGAAVADLKKIQERT